ncbi:MAG: hypothetical protein ABWY05_03550 [Noviherbaspirillum sp.]
MSRAAGVARIAAVGTIGLAYACLAHYTNTTDTGGAGALCALAPIAIGALVLAWRARQRLLAMSLVLAACAAAVLALPLLQRHTSMIYWFEHAATQSLLCVAFARTLAPGREPMVSAFARMVHGGLGPEMVRYTRQVTVAWSIFFGAMALVSTVVFFGAPVAVWSTFANFFTAPLIVLMFVAEYAVRRRVLPDMDHATIIEGVQAFWKTTPGK